MFKTYVAKDIYEYISVLKEIRSTEDHKETWFRGQSNANFRLDPSALRNTYAISDKRGNAFTTPFKDNTCSGSDNERAFLPVNRMVDEFRKEASKFIEYEANTDVEWECIAQHYGIPTRLLDWTTDAMYALYFATFDCTIELSTEDDINYFLQNGFSGSGGAVFVIDPYKINKHTIAKDWYDDIIPDVLDAVDHSDIIRQYLEEPFPPLCFHGFNKEKRISRQSGNFSTTGTLLYPMDYFELLQSEISKIMIPYSSYKTIRDQLTAIGITHNNVYIMDNDKDRIARNIAEETKRRFTQLMENNAK